MYIIKTGGALLARKDTKRRLAEAWQQRDEDWVLVHGGGPQLDQALRAVDGPPKKIDGLRVTSPQGAEVVRKTLSIVGADLVAGLREAGVPAVQIPPEAEVLQAVPKASAKGDLGRVGTATSVRTDLILAAQRQGALPVITPVGWDAEGPLNINADEAAGMVAMALEGKRLVLATDVDAVHGPDGESLARLTPMGAKALMAAGVAKGGMHAKLDQANNALAAGVPEVRIGSVDCAWDEDTGTTMASLPLAMVPQ